MSACMLCTFIKAEQKLEIKREVGMICKLENVTVTVYFLWFIYILNSMQVQIHSISKRVGVGKVLLRNRGRVNKNIGLPRLEKR